MRLQHKNSAAIFLLSVWLVVCLVGLYGYVWNIILLTQCDFAAPFGEEVVRVLGCCVPFVGAITGFITM